PHPLEADGRAARRHDHGRQRTRERQYVHRGAAPVEGEVMANELILIVEDNEKNLKLARHVLRFHGFRTIEAADRDTAITMRAEQLPALVLMDMQLPGMDGIAEMKR